MRKALVAICHNLPVVYTATTRSLQEIGWGDHIAGTRERCGFENIHVQWFTSSPRVDMLRNQACHAAIERDYTHLVFLDADMTWPGDILARLLAHHEDGIVAGVYVVKGPPYAPVHLLHPWEENGQTLYERLDLSKVTEPDLIDVDVVGMGCTVLPVATLRAMGDGGWFVYEDDTTGMPRVSEDVPFCRRAKATGVRISVDPTIKCDHLAVTPWNVRHHIRYQESVAASKELGPTVSIQKAG